jgi:hypothetical protein
MNRFQKAIRSSKTKNVSSRVQKHTKSGGKKSPESKTSTGSRLPRVIPHTSGSKLHTAIAILANNTVTTFEGKSGASSVAFDPEVQSLASSLVDMNTVYKFRLTNSANLTSTGGGVLQGYENADPSGGSGSTWTATEWSALITLFSEVKMDIFQLWFSPVAGLTQGAPLIISSVLSSVTANPTSVNQVLDNADAEAYQFCVDKSKHPYKHTLKGTNLGWAVVTTPNPGSYAGCPGAIQYYGDGYSTGTTVAKLYIMGVYSFRSRI